MKFTVIKNIQKDSAMSLVLKGFLLFILLYIISDIFVMRSSFGISAEAVNSTLFGNEEAYIDPINEASFLELIKEEKVEFVSSIVLGMNDGLIELTGALAGFSLALSKPAIVAMAGLITGISAALSMAASAYMATKHEVGSKKPPAKVATYTGISYIIVVAILVTPYFIFSNVFISLTVMLGLVILIIAGMTLYTSVLFRRKFHHQFGQMLLFSLGVALISFTIAYLFQRFSGIGV